MSIAIRWGETNDENGGFIYMDAVTTFTQNHNGQVTKHPVDTGGVITDHFIRDNPIFTISAVITGVDISTGKYLIQDLEGNSPVNSQVAPSEVNVLSTDSSVLSRFIPNSLSQFIPESTPAVVMDSARADLLEEIRQALISLMSGVKYNESTGQFDSNVEVIRLYEYEGNLIKRVLNNIVMTNVTFNEDVNTGSALYCNMTFEQVTFVSLQKVQVPKRVTSSLTKKAASKKSAGKCDSSVKSTSDPNNPDSTKKKEQVETSALKQQGLSFTEDGN